MSARGGTALVMGATSDIGRAAARRLAAEGYALQLAARDPAGLDREVRDIRLRTRVTVTAHLCDVLQADGGAARVLRTNYVGPALLLGALAERFAARGSGVLVGVSSVAGERGRAANYVYGSAKAGLTAFLSGLRNRLAATGVHVVTVKSGFVRSRMTDGMDLPALLTANPEEVADALAAALRRRRDIVYVRRIWRPIMALVRGVPECLFKRMRV